MSDSSADRRLAVEPEGWPQPTAGSESAGGGASSFFASQNQTDSAGDAVPRFVENIRFSAGKPVAILPRGFAFGFADDHHLLQIAYNADHHVRFQIDADFASWKTSVISKDDDGFPDVASRHRVTVVGLRPAARFP